MTQEGQAVVTAVVRSPARFTPAELGTIGHRLSRAPDGSAPQLQPRHVQVKVVAVGL